MSQKKKKQQEQRLLLDLLPDESQPAQPQVGPSGPGEAWRPYLPPRLRARRDQDEVLMLVLAVLDG